VTQRRSKDNKGSDPLVNGAASDQYNYVSEKGSRNVIKEYDSQRLGYILKGIPSEGDLEVRCVRRNLSAEVPNTMSISGFPDPRELQEEDLCHLVEQVETLSVIDKDRLCSLLKKYLSHMTTKPGKCRIFKYKFQVIADKPIVGYSRAIPFATRPAVREKIKHMVKDDSLEVSLCACA
jgi:hypothetical protein